MLGHSIENCDACAKASGLCGVGRVLYRSYWRTARVAFLSAQFEWTKAQSIANPAYQKILKKVRVK